MFTPAFLNELVARAGREQPGGEHSGAVLLQLLATAEAVRDGLRRTLAEQGGTELGFEVLSTLRDAADATLPPSVIAARCGIFRGTLTDVLARLEACGLVARHRNPADRRQLLAQLTPRGRRHCENLIGHYVRALLGLAGPLPPAALGRLDAALAALSRGAGAEPFLFASHES